MRNNTDESPSDQELARRVTQGDRAALAVLYERYFGRLFDFARRITRDDDSAADVVQTTFIKSWQAFRKGPPENVKAWFFALARNAAIDELRRQRRLLPAEDEADEASPLAVSLADMSYEGDPQAALRDKEIADLVWQSAAALRPSESSLLDLYLRQGLSAGEIAAALGLSKGALYTSLSRAKDALERSVVASLLFRRGRRDCVELDELLARLQARELTRAVHQAILGHLERCRRCQESRRRLASPAELFAALPPAIPPPSLQEAVWRRISAQLEALQAGRRKLQQRRLGLAASAAMIGLIALVWLGLASDALHSTANTATPSVTSELTSTAPATPTGTTTFTPVTPTVTHTPTTPTSTSTPPTPTATSTPTSTSTSTPQPSPTEPAGDGR